MKYFASGLLSSVCLCLMLILFQNASAPPVSVPLSCQSYSNGPLCLHTSMPLLTQIDTSDGKVLNSAVGWTQVYPENSNRSFYPKNYGANGFNTALYTMGLLEYVNLKYGYTLGWDPGWCGGVSSAMNLKTYALESNASNSYLASQDVNYFITQTFASVGTNVQAGGTSDSGVQRGYSNLTGHASSISSFVSLSSYLSSMPLYGLHIHNSGGDHELALNGVDGSYYKLFDPWGSIYDVGVSGKSISFVNGSTWGFIPDNSDSSLVAIVQISSYDTVASPPFSGGGAFGYMGNYYYSNGVGAYCSYATAPANATSLPTINPLAFGETEEGICGNVLPPAGNFTFAGNSYYFNGSHAYCLYSASLSNTSSLRVLNPQTLPNVAEEGVCGGGNPPAGQYTFGGNYYYYNGGGAYCLYSSPPDGAANLRVIDPHSIANAANAGVCGG